MKKRVLSLLLCIMLVVGMVPTTAFAGVTGTWEVNLNVSESSEYKYNGQNTLALGFGVQSDDLKLKTAQSIVLAIDLNVLDFLQMPDSDVEVYNTSDTKLGENENVLATTAQNWNVNVYCCKSSDGKTGYMQILASTTKNQSVTTLTNIATVYLGFKSGKSIRDLTSTSIRLINKAEAVALEQSSAVMVTDGNTNTQHAILADGSTDTLKVTPKIVWNGITPSKPAYSGTIDAPTVKTNAGGKVELNAVTPSAGGTVKYGYSTSASTAPTTWQDGTTFSGLHVGDTLYFYAKVEGTTEYQELVSAATSVTVLDKELTNLEITTPPSTKAYTHGDTFKTDGMKVKATYSDDSSNDNFTGYTVAYETSGKGYLCKDNTKVTLNAGGKSVEVTGLTVKAKPLTVTGLTAVDREYKPGDTLVNLTGGTLTGVVSGETVSLLSTPTTGRIDNAGVGDNKDVSIDPLSLTGANAGNYTLTQPTGIKVNITRKNISGATIALGTQATYNGSEQGVVISKVTVDGTDLIGTDYTITSGGKATNVEEKTLKITGKGNYTGEASATWTLVAKDIGDASVSITLNSASYDYTGSAINPSYTVKDNSFTTAKTLTVSQDYTANITDNTNVGTATLTITGKGNYKGTKTATFTINAKDVSGLTATISDQTTIKGVGEFVDPVIKGVKDEVLTGTLTYAYGSETGKTHAEVVTMLKGKNANDEVPLNYTFRPSSGNYTGTKTGSFKVTVKDIEFLVGTAPATVANALDIKADPTYGDDWSKIVKIKDGVIITAKVGTNTDTDQSHFTLKQTGKPGAGSQAYTLSYNGTIGGNTYNDVTVVSGTVDVAPKTLTAADLTHSGPITKVYDTNTNAPTGLTVSVKPDSLVSGDTLTVTGTLKYNSANVNEANKITFTPTAITAGNYRLAATEVLTINNAKITAKDVKLTGGINATDRSYVKDNKTVSLTKGALTFTGLVSGETLDVNIPATGTISDAAAGNGKTVTYSGVTLKDGTGKASNYTLVSPLPTVTVNITQASTPTAPTGLTGVKGNNLASVALPIGWSWANPTQTMTTDGSQTFTANYTDPEGNYAPGTGISVHVDVKAKTGVSTNITFHDGKLVYTGSGQEYKNATISGIIAGDTPSWTYTYTVDPSTATATLDATTGLPKTVGKYKVVATYEDSANYGTAIATLEITPAKPTGTPTFTKITEKGKTLADANLGMGTLTPTGGTLEWVAGDTTVVEANKAYEWKYTPAPADAVNYAPVTGTIVVYPVSTGIVIYSPCYTIKASAGANGTISPAGWCSVVENGSQTFTFTPDKGYTVAKVLVDGKSVGAVKSYTFKNVTKDHTIEVIFMKSNGNPATGVFVMP